MHASTEQLLSLRDGEPIDAALRTHVERCDECRVSLAQFESMAAALRALPQRAPPPAWEAIARRLEPDDGVDVEDPVPGRWAAAGVAAAVIVALAVLWPAGRESIAPPREERLSASVEIVAADPQQRIDDLSARSRLLEAQWRQLSGFAPSVVRVSTALRLDALRSRVEAMDASMVDALADASDPALAETYWRERVNLLDSMVAVQRAALIENDSATFLALAASDSAQSSLEVRQ